MTFDEVGGTGESSGEVVTFPAVATSMTEPHFSTGLGVYHKWCMWQCLRYNEYHSQYTQPNVLHKVYMAKHITKYIWSSVPYKVCMAKGTV